MTLDTDPENVVRVVTIPTAAWQMLCIALFTFIILASGFSAYRIQKVDQWMRQRTEYEASRDAAWDARFVRIDAREAERGDIFRRIEKLLDERDAMKPK